MSNTIQIKMDTAKAGQFLICKCLHCQCKFKARIQRYPSDQVDSGKRFVDCPKCHLGYFWMDKPTAETINNIEGFNLFGEKELEQMPENGWFYADRRLEVHGSVEKETVWLILPY